MKLPWTKAAPAQRKIIVVRSTQMRIADWTSDPHLVRTAYDLLQRADVQTILAILRNESPTSYGLPLGASHDDRIAHACRAEGYAMALNNLEAMAQLAPKTKHLETTFASEEPQPVHAVQPHELA